MLSAWENGFIKYEFINETYSSTFELKILANDIKKILMKHIKDNKIILSFTNTGSGLIVKGGGELEQFAIAGADKKFIWAQTKIEGNSVVVWHENIRRPVAVRYAWANNPEGANLYNQQGLPASPFRTDD